MGDDVPLPQTAVLGRVHRPVLGGNFRSSHHHNAIGEELDAHGTPHWNHFQGVGSGAAQDWPQGQSYHQHHQDDPQHRLGHPHPWFDLFVQ